MTRAFGCTFRKNAGHKNVGIDDDFHNEARYAEISASVSSMLIAVP